MQAAAAEPRAACGWDPGAAPAALLLGVLASDARLAVRALRRDAAVASDVRVTSLLRSHELTADR